MNFNNDAEIAARTLKKGGVLRFPGEAFPGGQDLSCDFGEEVRAPQLQDWCNMVRSENERQTEQAARERSKEAALAAAERGRTTNAQLGGGSGATTADPVQSLEEELQAREDGLVKRVAELDDQLDTLRERRRVLWVEAQKARAARGAIEVINEYGTGEEVEADNSPRPDDSPVGEQVSGDPAQPRAGDSGGLGEFVPK